MLVCSGVPAFNTPAATAKIMEPLGGWCDLLPRRCCGEDEGEHCPVDDDGKDFLKQKISQEKVRTARLLLCLVSGLRSTAGSFHPAMSHLWLSSSCVKSYQSH